jgi:galactarate dehydratase
MATTRGQALPPLEGYTFEGYRNADGSVGTRNILAITTDGAVRGRRHRFAVQRIKAELLPRYPNVDDVVALEHGYGCGVAIDAPDAIIPIRTLRNISLNPNFGGEVMVVSLGCEKLQPERLLPPGLRSAPWWTNAADPGAGRGVPAGRAHVGFMSMVESILRQAETHLQRLNARRRETVPASELVVGVQCGGSDAFSGVTANPAVGFCTDLLVRAGASVMFSRDHRGARRHCAAHRPRRHPRGGRRPWCARWPGTTPTCSAAAWTAAPTPRPGNKKGGLSNIVEKAMGSIVKSGSAPIAGVLSPGEKLRANPGPDLCRHARQRLHLRHAATGRGHEPACVHHRPRHALRPGRVPR